MFFQKVLCIGSAGIGQMQGADLRQRLIKMVWQAEVMSSISLAHGRAAIVTTSMTTSGLIPVYDQSEATKDSSVVRVKPGHN